MKTNTQDNTQDNAQDNNLWHYQCSHCGLMSGLVYWGCFPKEQKQAPICCRGEAMDAVLLWPKEREIKS